MVSATIVGGEAVVRDGVVYAWFRVDDDVTLRTSDGTVISSAVEWPASTPRNNPDGSQKTPAQIKADLIQNAKALRDTQKATRVAVAVSGTATL